MTQEASNWQTMGHENGEFKLIFMIFRSVIIHLTQTVFAGCLLNKAFVGFPKVEKRLKNKSGKTKDMKVTGV